MKLYYENSIGRVDFGFGDGEINVLALDGFGPVNAQYKTWSYYGRDGEYTTDEHVSSRCISISCDMCGSNMRVSKILSVLSSPGWLHACFGEKNRRIFCRRTAVSEPSRFGKYIRCVFQLTADMPYFEDTAARNENVYHIIKLIGPSFKLPAMLGRFVTETTIMNSGDRKCEPVIYIINNKVLNCGSAGFGIEIRNKTNGSFLKLNTNTQPGEIITVDIPNRRIESNKKGNMLFCISDDTYLNSFVLEKGMNELSVINRNTNEKITVATEFSPRFAEAVY